jgi:hypothetical protein
MTTGEVGGSTKLPGGITASVDGKLGTGGMEKIPEKKVS